MASEIRIDDEFRQLLFPLSAVEFSFLEQSIIKDGCQDPIDVWNDVIVDGHNRYDICTRNGIRFQTRQRRFASREDALDWIDRNQAGRRNVASEDYDIIVGRIYNRRKKQGSRSDLTSRQVGGKSEAAKEVAQQFDLSPRTVERNGQRAAVFDRMQEIGDEQAADAAKVVPQKVIAETKPLPAPEAAEVLKKHVHVVNLSKHGCDWPKVPMGVWVSTIEALVASGQLQQRPDGCVYIAVGEPAAVQMGLFDKESAQ